MGLKSQTKYGILAIVFFVLALFLLMSKFDVAGNGGILIKDNITIMLGVGYLLLPLYLYCSEFHL